MADLRQELKAWERDFVQTHGRKPRREDIKRDGRIEAKYKAYNHANRASQDTTTSLQSPSQGQKRKHASDEVLRERPQNSHTATPRKARKSVKETGNDENRRDSSVEPDPTPAFVRCALGPTPQRDGQVLDIFDMLPSASPSKPCQTMLQSEITILTMTPTKRQSMPTFATPSTSARTPQSSSKRLFLDAFAAITPKRKRNDETPSTARRQFATPSFLRRNFALAPIAEEDLKTSVPAPFKKRTVVRSLSTIIRGLKTQEDERLDEELDILAELEAEQRGGHPPSPNAAMGPTVPRVLVQDSQASEMPLGPDRAPAVDDELDATDLQGSLGLNGLPRKVWKKKGLKRQTKRVNMRPVLHRPKKEGGLDGGPESDGEAVVEMRKEGSDEEYDGHDGVALKSNQGRGGDGDIKHGEKSRAVVTATTTKKKISAQAHANFRKLKIKNKNGKANGRGRFGRR